MHPPLLIKGQQSRPVRWPAAGKGYRLGPVRAARVSTLHRWEGVVSASTGANAALVPSDGAPIPRNTSWGGWTEAMVALSTVPFSTLVLPQVLTNYANMQAGNLSALAVVSWTAWMSACCGNLLMFTHFSNSGERMAILVQLVGMCGNMAVLSQLWYGRFMPELAFIGLAGTIGVGCLINSAKLMGLIPETTWKEGPRLWEIWQILLGLAAFSALPQVLWMAIFPNSTTIKPLFAGFSVTTTLFCLQVLTGRLRASTVDSLIAKLPGLGATALFALSPIPQLVRNFTWPSSLAGLSLGTMLLALVGNALCVPRALCVRDRVWLAGCAWATVGQGWLQLLSMALGRSPATGARYLGVTPMVLISVTLLIYLGIVLIKDAQYKGTSSPMSYVHDTLSH